MILEAPPQRTVGGEDLRSHHIITISGRTPTAFSNNKQRLISYLSTHPQTRIQDLAYTTTARRMHFSHRSAHVAGDVETLVQSLINDNMKTPVSQKPSVVFVFPGQGSNSAGMAKELFETCASFHESLVSLESICLGLGFPSVLELLVTESPVSEPGTIPITQTQLALLCFELALSKLWESWGIEPDAVIGHSLGEYAALCASGVLTVSDALYLVGRRAELMQKECSTGSHAMLALRTSLATTQELIQKASPTSCTVSCINAPNATVISGAIEDIKIFQEYAKNLSIQSTVLDVPFAFHSSQMDPILTGLDALGNSLSFGVPSIPIVSTLWGKIVTSGKVFSGVYMAQQARREVNFLGAIRECEIQGLVDSQTLWFGLGPDTTCLNMVSASLKVHSTSLLPTLKSDKGCWKSISNSLAHAYAAGITIDWSQYHKDYKKWLSLLELPSYAFDLKNYWIQYEGDWALTRNRPSELNLTASFSSTCLHKVAKESFQTDQASVTFISDLREPKLFSLIQGHLVNGVGLCPSAVYAEMAITATRYIYSKLDSLNTNNAVEITDTEFFRPLIVTKTGLRQTLKLNAVKSSGSDVVRITVSSETTKGCSDHATCAVRLGEKDQWLTSWSRNSYLIKSRLDMLEKAAADGIAHQILGPMAYKLFSNVVEYSSDYKGMTEVLLDSELIEGTAKVQLKRTITGHHFSCNPHWLDGVLQIAGFVLNGNVTTPPDIVYMSSGWESLRIATPFSHDKLCFSHVKMQPVENTRGLFIGDISIFQDGEIVAVGTGIKFQEIKKSILHLVLPGSLRYLQQALHTPPNPTLDNSASKMPSQSYNNMVLSSSGESTPRSDESLINFKGIFAMIVTIIAEELGLKEGELGENTELSQLGIDSLLTISIITRIRSETKLDLPASVLTSNRTISQLQVLMKKDMISNTATSHGKIDGRSSIPNFVLDEPQPAPSTALTAATVEINVSTSLMKSIMRETGINSEDIDGSTTLQELGIDSLLGIAILGDVKEETGVDLPASWLAVHLTVSSLLLAVRNLSDAKPQLQLDMKSSNAVYLQGDKNSQHPALFLCTDGAGSAASYLHLPQISSNIPVYGLESPFLQCPSEFTGSISEICSIFVSKIRSIQPHGPYMLGGWSIGGIYAYECAYQLQTIHHEKLHGILLIDSPCPNKLENLPDLTLQILEETGIFARIPKTEDGIDDAASLSMKSHLLGCVKSVVSYDPTPLPKYGRPNHVFIIWATQGLFEELTTKVKEASEMTVNEKNLHDSVGLKKDWLTAKRSSFGPMGWDRLLGRCDCHNVKGDHFSIMNRPGVRHIIPFCVQESSMLIQ
jgi:iterative type I PKS product template protein